MAPAIAASFTGSNHYSRPLAAFFFQQDTTKKPKPTKGKKPNAILPTKSTTSGKDSTKKDSSGLKSQVTSHAEDSTIVDQVHQLTYLYGRARIKYEDFELDADYIRIDQKNHLLFAKGSIDPLTKKYIGRPISQQGKDKPLESDSLLFNYNTKIGKLWNPATEQDQNYISGGEIKRLNETEAAYHNVLFSTCSLPYPDTHFGIVITRGIAEKNRIISGPAYLEIEGIPLPLAIPFGFFPKPDTRSSGVIIPTFGEDQKLGFYLRNFGYYVGISDYMDLTNMGSIYSKGSYAIDEQIHYLKRYKYGGNISFAYNVNYIGLEGDPPQKAFNVTWTHTQDPNANPGSTLSASVNAGTSSYYQSVLATQGSTINLQSAVQGSLQSSVNYSKSWAGTPFNLSTGLSLRQDVVQKTLTAQLPTLNFSMASLSPFDSKDRVGEQKWYQKITVSYNLQASNELDNVQESSLFQGNTFAKNLQTRISHTIPVSLSLNFLKFFQFSTNVNYVEHWYLQSIRENYGRGSITGQDTILRDTLNGFKRAGSYTMGASVSTKVYSTIYFKKGNLIAIRHVMTPTVGFSYNPDFTDPSYGYYKTIVSNATVPYPYATQKYSIFPDGFPSLVKSAGVSLSLDNTLEMKLKPKATDTTGKGRKIPILQGFTISTFYNFAADSLRLSPIQFSAHTAIFDNKVNLTFNGSLNPYVTQVLDSISNGQIQRFTRVVNRYTFQDGQFPKLTNFTFSMSGALNPATFHPTQLPQPGTTLQSMNAQQAQRLAVINSDPSAYVDFNIPWNLTFNYSFSYANSYISTNIANTLMLSGDVNLTQNWKVQYSTNYDIRARKLAVTQFSIYRNLHCWDLNVSWVPFGVYKSYNVTLKVKSTILQDLKLSKRSDYSQNQSFQ